MLKLMLLLTAVGSCVIGQGLGPGPEPGEGELHPEKKQARRNLGFPFLPIYIPYQQVVEVHHVVMLQQPNCVPPQTGYQPGQPQVPQPGQPPVQLPGYPPFQPPVASTPSPDLFNRINPANTTASSRPSRCVWAIVACCSPESTSIRYSCFELLGCPGSFWGVNPCEGKVVQAAANTALNFYMSGGQEPPAPDVNNV